MRTGRGRGRHISHRSSSEQVGVSAAVGAGQETAEEDERCLPLKREVLATRHPEMKGRGASS